MNRRGCASPEEMPVKAKLAAVVVCLFLVAFLAPAAAFCTTLEEKIGQMIMVGFRGTAVDDAPAVADDIEAGRIGGVVIFDYDVPTGQYGRNIISPEQVRRLTADLQARAPVPLFIAVDQEGGRVSRLKEACGFPFTPSQRALGRIDDTSMTRAAAGITADALIAAGININFAPVVDLDRNPMNPVIGGLERSFSADPAVVIRHARVMIGTYRRKGVISTLKHFPGHGSSDADSHEGFVDVTGLWSEEELIPFATLIQEGRADLVMTAHLFNETIDPVLPATLSRATIDSLLRGRLGYDGVVISDDLQMKALRDCYGFTETVERAVLAGVDILLFANNSVYDEEASRRAAAVIASLLERGVIDAGRIDRSFRRIMDLKSRVR